MSLCPYTPPPQLPQGSPSRTCMISHRPSAPARVPVLGIILHQDKKRKAVVPRTEKRTGEWLTNPRSSETSYDPDGCSHPGSLTPSGTGGCRGRWEGAWLSQPGLQAAPTPHPGLGACGALTTLSQLRGDLGSVPLHGRHIRPVLSRVRPPSAAQPLDLPKSSQLRPNSPRAEQLHRPKASTGAHLSGQPQGDVAFLSRVHDLHFEVVATGAQRVPGLGQPHVHDALALAQVLQ